MMIIQRRHTAEFLKNYESEKEQIKEKQCYSN